MAATMADDLVASSVALRVECLVDLMEHLKVE